MEEEEEMKNQVRMQQHVVNINGKLIQKCKVEDLATKKIINEKECIAEQLPRNDNGETLPFSKD